MANLQKGSLNIMKTIISVFFILMLTFVTFGQNRPTPKPIRLLPPSRKVKTIVAKKPTQQVTVIKLDGKVVVGLFLSGDTELISLQVGDSVLPVKISEIVRISFGNGARVADTPVREGIADRIGSANQDTSPVSGGVLNGKAVTLIKPEYPAAARAVRASGAVNVQVTIDEQGVVISAAAVSGHPLLRQAAENAARTSKFAPTTLEGQPIQITGIIVYNFLP